jgi:PAS domain S-box-containing protein
MEQSLISKRYSYLLVGILVFLGLYLASLYNYLLFHSLAEIFSIVVACGIFMVTWNSRRFLDNNYLLLLGIAYLFVGGLDLIHTLAYKGMGVFHGYETNLATQLWTAARYMESLSLFLAPFLFGRKLKVNFVFLAYALATFLLLLSIFYWNIFPVCFIEGIGLTPFKKISEYIISLILLASIALLLNNRREFEREVLQWIVCSIIVSIASGLAFTFYIDAYGFSNLIGHFFKILSFYFIYKAIIETGLTKPYDLLFRNLKQSEMTVREEKNRIQSYLDIAGVILVVIGADQKVNLINKKGCEILGHNENEMIGKNWFDTFIPKVIREEARASFSTLMKGETNPVEYLEIPVLTKTGEERIIAWHNAVLRDEKGNVVNTLSSGEDVTERKQMEKELTRLASFPQLNPNPVIEVDLTGQIHYLNPATEQLFPDLKKAGIEHPWLTDLEKIADTLEHEQKGTHTRELRAGDIWYQQTIHSVMEGTRLRIYGFNITKRKKAEEAIRASEERMREQAARLQAVLDTAPAIIWIAHDKECREIIGNRAAYVSLRVSEGTDVSKSGSAPERLAHFRVFKDGVELTVREMPMQRVAASGQGLSDYSMELVFDDGTVRSLLGNVSPVLDPRGQPNGAIAAFVDITERKRMAEELRKSRDELELRVQERTAELTKANEKLGDQSRILEGFFTSTITPLVFLDRDFNFVRVNEAYAKSCQREISEFAGHNHFEFYPHEKNEAIFRKVVETKIPFQTFARPFTFPDHPEWGVTYWDWTLTPLLDGRGEVEFLVFALEDVTERKRAEEELRAASLYARSLIEASLDPLVTISAEGKVTDVNRATELATGVPRDQLIGSDFSDYFTEPEKAREGYRQVFEIGSVKDYPLSIRHTSGDIIEVLYNAAVYRNEAGEVQGVFAAARDITERKRAEEAAQAQYALREAIENSLVAGIMVVEKDGKLAHANPAFYRMTGWKEEELIGSMPPFAFWPPETLEIRAESLRALLSGKIPLKSFEARLRRKNGESFDALVVVSSLKNAQGKALGWVASIGNITQRKETERQINATNALLSLFSKKSLRKEYLDSVVDLIQSWSGCRCVGIRVLNKQGDIPYQSYVGFSREFWESENWLSVQRDQCICIRIVTGKSDPQDISVITPGGSFHCGNTITFVNNLSEEEKSRYRGVCIQNGFLSVTIIPIRYLDKIVGAIHLADEREAFMPLSIVEFLESMAPLIGEAVNRLNLEEELRESENRLRSLSSHLLTVQENERKRIAMELHDSIGQMLTAIKFKVENTLQEKGKGKARAREKSLEAIVPMVRESVEEVRRIQMDLRPSTLDDLGVLATLEWFCREYQRIYSHIHVEKEIGLQENEVSPILKTVIYRLTQEALNNIAKHSKADLVHLSLRKKGDRIELVIKDNGTGFDLAETLSSERSKRGLGLNSMRERAELSGGTFEIETTTGKGTVIKASWPIVMR